MSTVFHEFGAWLFFHNIPTTPMGLLGVAGFGFYMHMGWTRWTKRKDKEKTDG